MRAPRVTLGIATYDRDTYLAEAIDSCLAQDYADFEVLVVVDGPGTEKLDAVLARYAADPRVRVVRHGVNRHIAAAYNTIVAEARGELIAMLGDDDLCEPDRLSRSVAIFDRHPDTGIVHGDAIVVDGQGRETGRWKSGELPPAELLQLLVRRHNYLIDPTRMVHRRVYEEIGGYREGYLTSQDFHFWLRAAPRVRFRHVPGAPVIRFRRHDESFSGDDNHHIEVDEVQRALREAFDEISLERLVPEVDWALLHPHAAERRAWEILADALDARELALPELAGELRERAANVPPAPTPAPDGRRIVLTSFGFNDSGGGTAIPRQVAKELVNRGWDVTVFHAAVAQLPGCPPYTVREWVEDGVRLVGVHNRAHGLFDLGHPLREVDDPPITRAFGELLDRTRPDVAHVHNLHNLGGALLDEAQSRGVPVFFSPHNHWLLSPRAYLQHADGSLCAGPGRGGDCPGCLGSTDVAGHEQRLSQLRAKVTRDVDRVLAMSHAVRRALLGAGYDPEQVDVIPQSVPAVDRLWEALGRDRAPGRAQPERLTVGFLGSLYGHKGPHVLVEAAQRAEQPLRVVLHGEGASRFGPELEALDRKGLIEIAGAYAPADLERALAGLDVAVLPSTVYETQGLVALECLAARVPVVVPRLGALPEAIRDGVDGLTFAPGDPDELAKVLDRLAAEPGLLERLQAGVRRPPTFAAYVDALEATYAGDRPGRVGDEPGGGPLAVRWQGDHHLHTSLANINRAVTPRLVAGGMHVQRVARSGASLDGPLPHVADVEVRHQWPPEFTPAPSGRLALIQPWEFGSIPEDWLEPIGREVDEVWVPSEYVRGMYVADGVDPDRVKVVPNGVDLERFSPDGPRLELDAPDGLRLLYVGGAIWRKGLDVLLLAYLDAFAGRDDVTLVIKDFGSDTVYRKTDRSMLRELIETGAGPRVLMLEDDLEDDDMAALYRACDVLVHPYRGEGFGMPVLEAMACGLPVLVTESGPTDEFCPPQAGWRVPSRRGEVPKATIDGISTKAEPWVREPDEAALRELLAEVDAAGPAARAARGAAGRAAAARLSWDNVAAMYAERLRALARRPRKLGLAIPEAELEGDGTLRILATPAWRAGDRLGELLAAWVEVAPPGTDACLHLLADPAVDGDPAALEAHVMTAAAAAGVELECADIDLRIEASWAGRDEALHAATGAYVPLHPACAGHERLARAAGSAVLTPDAAALRAWLAAAAAPVEA
jgi:glycosyltransferase involved in cell wall biosynthesis